MTRRTAATYRQIGRILTAALAGFLLLLTFTAGILTGMLIQDARQAEIVNVQLETL